MFFTETKHSSAILTIWIIPSKKSFLCEQIRIDPVRYLHRLQRLLREVGSPVSLIGRVSVRHEFSTSLCDLRSRWNGKTNYGTEYIEEFQAQLRERDHSRCMWLICMPLGTKKQSIKYSLSGRSKWTKLRLIIFGSNPGRSVYWFHFALYSDLRFRKRLIHICCISTIQTLKRPLSINSYFNQRR